MYRKFFILPVCVLGLYACNLVNSEPSVEVNSEPSVEVNSEPLSENIKHTENIKNAQNIKKTAVSAPVNAHAPRSIASRSIVPRSINSQPALALHPANIAEVIRLATPNSDDSRIHVNLVTEELGASTDVSPRYAIYFTLYRTDEMLTAKAAFLMGHYFSLISVKAVSDTTFELIVRNAHLEQERYVIDATEAIDGIRHIDCGSEFDCRAATAFEATITLSLSR